MDNRNDFIHIDEVFKRLKDKEEPEPSGAWLRMQDLLNEEMPVGAPAAGSSMLRRYMTPLVALLLLGSGAAYYAVTSNNAKDAQKVSLATGNHVPANNHYNASATSSNENGVGLKTSSLNQPASGNHSNNNHPNNNHSGNTATAAHNNASANGNNNNEHHYASGNNSHAGKHSSNNKTGVNTAETVATSNVSANNNVTSTSQHTTHSNGVAKHDAHKNGQSAASNASNVTTTSGNVSNVVAANNIATQNGVASTSGNVNNNRSAAQNTVNGVSNANNTSANNSSVLAKAPTSNTAKQPASIEEQNVVEQIFPASSNGNTAKGLAVASTSAKHNGKGSKNNDPSSVTAAAGMSVVASNWKNNTIVKDKDGSYYKEVRDTFKKIDMMERTVASNENSISGAKKYTSVIDTLAITRIERIKYLPLQPLEMVALRQEKIIPQSYIASPIPAKNKPKQYTVTNEMVSLVPLANYKVNSRKVDPSKFNKLVTNTTQGISNYFDGTNKFYAAILLGGNTFLSNTGAFGMQFGIAGLYQLSERLTLGLEFKFANHYFSNYTINDKSISYDNVNSQQVSGIEWLFTGTQTTSSNAYKVNSFSELQFPLTLNYSFGRLSVLGGLNLAYAFPVKWSTTNTVTIEDVSASENSSSNPFLNANATIDNTKDFSSRFGMGYVGGLSYDVSRKVSLDARVTQNLWSSYNGGAENINKLFKTPTFQFSISYFFGRKDRVVYIMDRR